MSNRRFPQFAASNLRRLVLPLTLFFVWVIISSASIVAQTIQYTANQTSLGLRSDFKVNPLTHALELQIPLGLGAYPQRGGGSNPTAISYSSRLWRMGYVGTTYNSSGQPTNTLLAPRYADNSRSGWTYSLSPPQIQSLGSTENFDHAGSPASKCVVGGGGVGGYPEGQSCCYIDRVRIVMGDGSTHEFRSTDQPICYTGDGLNVSPIPSDDLYAVDGSRMRYNRATNILYLPDGSFWTMSDGGYFDRNGNRLLGAGGDSLGRPLGNPLANSGTSYSATFPGVGGTSISYTFIWKNLSDSGVLTTPQTLPHFSDYNCALNGTGCDPNNYLFTSDTGYTPGMPILATGGLPPFDPVVLYKIELPTGQAYIFTYNKYGEIDKVQYPTGGYERFAYAQNEGNPGGSPAYAQGNRGVTDRWVSVKGDGTDEVQNHWQYGGTSSDSDPYLTSTSRATFQEMFGSKPWSYGDAREKMPTDEIVSAGNQTLRRKLTQWDVTGSNWSGNGPFFVQENAKRNARVTREVEIVLDTGTSNALAKTTVHNYDFTYEFTVGPIETSVVEYDWVSISQSTANLAIGSIPTGDIILRTVESTNLLLDPNISQGLKAAYLARNLVSLITGTRVKDAAGNVVAATSISYDEGGQFAQLSDYATVLNWTNPGANVVRGNPTSVSRWLNFNGSTFSTFPNGTYVTTHAQYDQCGSVRKSWDARDTGYTNPSLVTYDDSFSDYGRNTYAYPTHTWSMVPDSSGVFGANAALTTSAIYDFNTGLVLSNTDPNGQTTSMTYGASLSRLSQVMLPNGAHVTYDYFDTPSDLYVRVRADLDSSHVIETRRYFDKLGRPNREFLYDGTPSTPWSVTDTYYDFVGRVSKVSDPYRVSGPSGAVPATCSACTTSVYDALGRVTMVTTPEGGHVDTAYAASTSIEPFGLTVTVVDQTLRQRRSLTDALGRLVRVDEPVAANPSDQIGNLGDVSSPNQPTRYSYDVLGNLRAVTQAQATPQITQQRFFTYDSLSRLIRAKSVEQGNFSPSTDFPSVTDSTSGVSNSQWSMGYRYDNNGNLTKRLDARNIMTAYGYDNLNRNTTVDYSGEPEDQSTPAIRRYYDAWQNGVNQNYPTITITNPYGRQWQVETTGTTGTLVTIDGFDVMGRPTQQEQQFNTADGWSVPFKVSRGYDAAGHVISQTYPSGHTVYYNYDIAGRLADNSQNQNHPTAFNGNLGDGVQRAYDSISGANAYDAEGHLQEEKFGTLTPLYHKRHFNQRGQLYDIRLSTQSWQAADQDGNRGALVNYYSAQNFTPGFVGSDNNGNLRRQEVYVPANGFYQQNFEYDALNRLSWITEKANGVGGETFKQENTYDRWGNRTINTQTTHGANINALPMTVDQSTNRLATVDQLPVIYDAAGNLLNDGHTFTDLFRPNYDAENRLAQIDYLVPSHGELVPSGRPPIVYVYDADGHRTRRVANGTIWQVYGMGGELLAEYQDGGLTWPQITVGQPGTTFLPQKEYAYRNGQLLLTASSGDPQRLDRFISNFLFVATGSEPDQNDVAGIRNGLLYQAANGDLDVAIQQFSHLYLDLDNSFSNYLSRGRTNSEFVTDLYFAYLQRPPDSGGLAFWVSQLSAGVSRSAVRGAFEDQSNVEFAAIIDSLLGRNATEPEVTYVGKLYLAANGPSNSFENDVANLKIAASESAAQATQVARTIALNLYQPWLTDTSKSNQDFAIALFAGFLQREPSDTELSTWIATVQTQGRSQALQSFANLPAAGQLAGTLYREILWLVPDQLGTPRIISERSGSLSGIKRHDYLPFGEELLGGPPNQPGSGGRLTTQGYGASDAVRQKFTSKERDDETGLDYFLARYYSSIQGRFTSADEFTGGPRDIYILGKGDEQKQALPYAEITTPQSLNKYTYCYNNPFRYIDPDGHDVLSYELNLSGPNRVPNSPHPELPFMTQLGPQDSQTGGYFALNLKVNFDTGDNIKEYKHVRTAIILNNGEVRSGSQENPSGNQTTTTGQSRIVFDEPGIGVDGAPKASLAGKTLVMALAAGEYNTKTNKMSTNVAYYAVQLVFDKNGNVDKTQSRGRLLTRAQFVQLTQKHLPKDKKTGQVCPECTLKPK